MECYNVLTTQGRRNKDILTKTPDIFLFVEWASVQGMNCVMKLPVVSLKVLEEIESYNGKSENQLLNKI